MLITSECRIFLPGTLISYRRHIVPPGHLAEALLILMEIGECGRGGDQRRELMIMACITAQLLMTKQQVWGVLLLDFRKERLQL